MLGVVSSNLITRSIYFSREVIEASRINDLAAVDMLLYSDQVQTRVQSDVKIHAGAEQLFHIQTSFPQRRSEAYW